MKEETKIQECLPISLLQENATITQEEVEANLSFNLTVKHTYITF